MSQQLPIYLNSPHTSKFSFIKNRIQKIIDNGWWHQLLMDVEVVRGRLFTFTIKIIKSQYSNILVGIVEKLARENERYSYSEK